MSLSLLEIKSADRNNYLDFLIMADESAEVVQGYIQDGEMYAIRYEGKDVGVVLFTFHSDKEVELKNIALSEAVRGKGLGKLVVYKALDLYGAMGYSKMWVGTANSSIANIAFYQKCGFRLTGIKKDFFAQYPTPIFEDGIRALDMLMFEQDLRNRAATGTPWNLTIGEMTRDYARHILDWKYEPPYDLYNSEATDEGMRELLEDGYKVILDGDEDLVGYFCTGKGAQVPIGHEFHAYADDFIDIGIGMNPVLTGKGNGTGFFDYVLNHVLNLNKGVPIRLTVATFNKRAIHLYEKFGFVKGVKFMKGPTEFITMVKDVN